LAGRKAVVDLGLSGKVAIVSGSSGGIGRAIALSLAAEGCRVVLCGRRAEPLAEAAEAVRQAGSEALPVQLDVTDAAALPELVAAPLRQWGRIDVLVNNVGANRRKPFLETTDEDWQAILDASLDCHVRLPRLVAPGLVERGGGAIVFVSSAVGREPGGPGLSLAATPGARLTSRAELRSLELAPHGVRVNGVAPGSMRFPGSSWDRRVAADPEGMAEFVRQNL